MSIATSMNLAIALVDGRANVARTIFREIPIQDVRDATTAQTRLLRSLDRRIKAEVYQVLNDLLQNTMTIEMPGGSMEEVEAFVEGVAAVEEAVNDKMLELRKEIDTDEPVDRPKV